MTVRALAEGDRQKNLFKLKQQLVYIVKLKIPSVKP